MLFSAANANFVPVLHVNAGASSGTETIPFGALQCVIQAWGAGGAGGGSAGVGGGSIGGDGGAAGGYSTITLNVAAQGGKTFSWVVGAGGTGVFDAQGNPGGATTISAGTITGFSPINCNGGGGGFNDGTGVGTGGTASNANAGATNITGANGGSHSGSSAGSGGVGQTGNTSGDGSPYGGGGAGRAGVGGGGAGFLGSDGAVAFYYS